MPPDYVGWLDLTLINTFEVFQCEYVGYCYITGIHELPYVGLYKLRRAINLLRQSIVAHARMRLKLHP